MIDLARLVGHLDEAGCVDEVHHHGDGRGDADGLQHDAVPLGLVHVGDGTEHHALEEGVDRPEEHGEPRLERQEDGHAERREHRQEEPGREVDVARGALADREPAHHAADRAAARGARRWRCRRPSGSWSRCPDRYGVYGDEGPSVMGTAPRGALAASAAGAAQPAWLSAFWKVFSLSTGLGMVRMSLLRGKADGRGSPLVGVNASATPPVPCASPRPASPCRQPVRAVASALRRR